MQKNDDPGSKVLAAIAARDIHKIFHLYANPLDRLKFHLTGRHSAQAERFDALKGVTFDVGRGEVVGVIGRNGAGKSTLLHLVCGTLKPSQGSLAVYGRVAALLELGAGFSPDFSGRENVYINAAILGLQKHEIDRRLDDILSFADIGDFIDHPVKTYSSGMFMRLAFSIATSVDPDILVIDEALSVGDGAFSRKSFDRIMRLKEAGKTILFCSHSMYQVEALCSRALWIDRGEIRMDGDAMDVTKAYAVFLSGMEKARTGLSVPASKHHIGPAISGVGRIVNVTASVDGGESGNKLSLRSGRSDLAISIEFLIDPALPCPSVAVGISESSGLTVASAGSSNDGYQLKCDPEGYGRVQLFFPKMALLKGVFHITCFLASEDGLHIYDQALNCVSLDVTQTGLEQGLVTLSHEWVT